MNYNEFNSATFKNKNEYCGFKFNKQYSLKVEEKECGIQITTIDEEENTLICPYCNLQSMLNSWSIATDV